MQFYMVLNWQDISNKLSWLCLTNTNAPKSDHFLIQEDIALKGFKKKILFSLETFYN